MGTDRSRDTNKDVSSSQVSQSNLCESSSPKNRNPEGEYKDGNRSREISIPKRDQVVGVQELHSAGLEEMIYSTLIILSPNERTKIIHHLNKRFGMVREEDPFKWKDVRWRYRYYGE